jgi:hypothetical protein
MAVDYLVPAEELEVTDFDGENRRVSGSSYAVSRLAALASRLLASQPELDIQGLKQAIRGLSIAEPGAPSVRIGVIPDPRADIAQVDWLDSSDRFPAYPDSLPRRPDGYTEVTMHSVQLDLRILDDRWQSEEIMPAIAAAETILGQCGIALSVKAVHRFSGTEYLRDFSIGSSYSLLNRIQSAEDPTIRLFFARDSRMQMQFEAEAFAPGNTRTRPWLRNSVWVMHGAPDLPETLAHELFHVLANDGGHVSGTGNLMAERTSPGRNRLTPAQCGLARQYFSRH